MSAEAKASFRTERDLVYADLGFRKLRMTLYLPNDDGEAVRPGMVLIHGGAWILGTRYQQAWYCRQFARNGFVVMTIDYRLMPGYAFPCCIHDCKAAVRWLRLNARRYRVDPDRIATFGASAGGHLAALLATTRPEHGLEGDINPGAPSNVCAAVILYGAVDLSLYRESPLFSPLGKMTTRFLDRFMAGNGAGIEAASPINYIDERTAPTMLVHGLADHFVHCEQSIRFHRKLLEAGVPARLIAVPDRGHAFDYIYAIQRRQILREMLAFLRQFCGDPFG